MGSVCAKSSPSEAGQERGLGRGEEGVAGRVVKGAKESVVPGELDVLQGGAVGPPSQPPWTAFPSSSLKRCCRDFYSVSSEAHWRGCLGG